MESHIPLIHEGVVLDSSLDIRADMLYEDLNCSEEDPDATILIYKHSSLTFLTPILFVLNSMTHYYVLKLVPLLLLDDIQMCSILINFWNGISPHGR